MLGLVMNETEKALFVLIPRTPAALSSRLLILPPEEARRMNLTPEGLLRFTGTWGILPPEEKS
jgi:uncharacterized membrane protein